MCKSTLSESHQESRIMFCSYDFYYYFLMQSTKEKKKDSREKKSTKERENIFLCIVDY